MDPEEELLQINIEETNTNLHKTLLHALQCRRYIIFKNSLENNSNKKYQTDINHIYGHPLNKSLLDIACCEGLTEFVDLLLRFGGDPNKLNPAHNRGPIHFATELGHTDVLRVLLEDPRTNPNLEAGRETALHLAVKNNNLECARVLLDNNASPNIPNAKGTTPIHVAAAGMKREMIETILNFSRQPPDLDNFWDFRKKTPRNLIENKFPDIQLPPVVERKIDFNVLRFYLDANDEKNFLVNLSTVGNVGIDELGLMMIASGKNFYNSVRELMGRCSGRDLDLSEAALVAIKSGNPKVLAEFFEWDGFKVTEEMLISSCRELVVSPPILASKQADKLECLRIILDQPNVNVRCEDDKGNTPLHYAARAESSEAVTLLLKSGSYLGHTNILGVPPLAHIAPNLLEKYFNDCLSSHNDCTDDYEINFDYTCLMPNKLPKNPHGNNFLLENNSLAPPPLEPEMYVLRYISTNRSLKNLLKHPLLSSYLYLKWHRLRKILYLNCAIYIFFYIFLNWYILTADKTKIPHPTNTTSPSREIWGNINTLWCFLVFFLFLILLRELLQFISSPRHYVMSFDNWLECLLIILTLTIVFGVESSAIGAVVILLSAWELVILISQHPRMSTGIEMFKTVSINLILFLLPYGFLILAFAMSFFTLFRDGGDDNFPDPGHSLFKTIIMLTGEFDANDIPFILYPILSRVIFIFFVFLIAIVLFNLLIGLAVSDTADILSESELVGLISRTELVSYAEKFFIESEIKKCWRFSRRRRVPFDFLARRILVFPNYLPGLGIAVKPFKNNVIRIYGGEENGYCENLIMDAKIVLKAREILADRGKISENEKIMEELERVFLELSGLRKMIYEIKETSIKNISTSGD